ncbi:hypothetical protein HHL22_05765 [Hymenobacter sp. RP-2-7]|uniref:Uncharacterized protein n=1 Tax=Hymenobacter polaris TaxID=2682546 RepID=A0A7Y0FLD9_9BACT|nr:hypothetical protein [Hymenobacter polaris]NML64708.1 hypothetical protein [Hymenobacter polaris]
MSASPSPAATALATRQLWLTVLRGVALALPLTLVLTLAIDWQRLAYLSAASWLLVVLKD